MDKDKKNAAIKQTIKNTRERHKNMRCRVFEVKVVANKLSHKKKELLNQYFLEAKWLRNSELAKGIENMDRNAKVATVKVGDAFEERPLQLLGSQVRQDIVDALRSEVRGLATRKRKGYKAGALRFKPVCNSIPLRQYGTTYGIDFEHNTISIQGMKRFPLKVRGLKQISELKDAEITSAKLIRKPSGLYFHIVVYSPLQEVPETGAVCGIDFGISTNLTLDNGDKYNVRVSETKGVKLASMRLNKSYYRRKKLESPYKSPCAVDVGKDISSADAPNADEPEDAKPRSTDSFEISRKPKAKKSKNHYRRVGKLQAAYEKQNNKKKDVANKIVHELDSKYDFIAIQDEMIAGWHGGIFGKQVQHSAMGTIKAKLKMLPKTCTVERSYPSTQICPKCMRNTKHPLSMREYNCQYCGYHHSDRDVKAAFSILQRALQISKT